MSTPLFDVIYIDKFRDPQAVAVFNEKARRRFGLNEGQLLRLATGDPVVVKRRVSYEVAIKYRMAFTQIGGICWVQPMAASKGFSERRREPRRDILDRRMAYRASTIYADRRLSSGRRTSDRGSM